MLSLEMLDVAIGMTFIFLMLSLICTAINEILEAWWKRRAVDLEKGIRELLHDESGTGLASKLYNHPLVFGLFRGGYNHENIKKTKSNSEIIYKKYKSGSTLPSYIPSRNFALALMDIVLPSEPNARSLQSFRNEITKKNGALAQAPQVQKVLLALVNDAGEDIDKARKNIETWYDSSMDRVAGWYKRRVQVTVLILGTLIAIFMNADTIAVYKSLTNDEPLRNSLVAATQEYAKAQESDNLNKTSPQNRIKANMDSLAALGLPIGWGWKSLLNPDPAAVRNYRAIPPFVTKDIDGDKKSGREIFYSIMNWLLKIIGWGLTAVAISLGAPFWFDVLNKFMVIRSTVKPHEKSPEESSEDRQNSRDEGSQQAKAVLSGFEDLLKGFNATMKTQELKKFEALSKEDQHKVMVEAIEQNEEKWKTIYPNVTSLATGNKYIEDKKTEIKCIVFYVKEKIKDKKQLGQTDTIPDYVEYKGFQIPTDVQPQKDMPVGENFNPPPLDPDEIRNRMPGCGISRIDSEELGSLGVVVYREDKEGNRTHYILSCFHVLCSSEFGNHWTEVSETKLHGKPEVVCPSLFDDINGASENIVAKISEGVITPYLDAVIAKLDREDSILDLEILKKPAEIYEPVAADEDTLTVYMRGRVSTPRRKDIKSGKLKHISSYPTILYEFPNDIIQRDMKRLIQTEKISDKGDSGGPVFTEEGKLIGIIVAGSSEYSYIIPIKFIMNRLDVRV